MNGLRSPAASGREIPSDGSALQVRVVPNSAGNGLRRHTRSGAWAFGAAWVLALSMFTSGASGQSSGVSGAASADPQSREAAATRLAQDGATVCGADCLARQLIEAIPQGERIAVIPFGPPRTGIPAKTAEQLYDRIAEDMSRASGGRHRFMAKDRRNEIWKSWQGERERSDYTAFWEKRRVDVTVDCDDRGLEDRGIALSCVAVSVGEKSRLGGDVRAHAVLAVDRRFFGYSYTLTDLGLALAQEVNAPKTIERVFIADRETRQRSWLTEHMGDVLGRVVRKRFEARRRDLLGQENMAAVTGQKGDGTATADGGYELRGTVTWMDETTLELSVELLDGRTVVATGTRTMQRDWLPEHVKQRRAAAKRYRASAHAFVSSGLDERSAIRAARNLARARVVAAALGAPAPKLADIRSEKDGVRALSRTLDLGIPVDERFQEPWQDANGGLKVELDARVVAVGSIARPAFEARLQKDTLRAGEEIRIEVQAREPVHAAVFAWGADNRIVRLYPNRKALQLSVPEDGRVVLPRAGEGAITSAPMPGNADDHEAIIVIASSERLAFDKLARPAGGTVNETMKAAVSGKVFFEALARLDLTRAALVVLPYRVME